MTRFTSFSGDSSLNCDAVKALKSLGITWDFRFRSIESWYKLVRELKHMSSSYTFQDDYNSDVIFKFRDGSLALVWCPIGRSGYGHPIEVAYPDIETVIRYTDDEEREFFGE